MPNVTVALPNIGGALCSGSEVNVRIVGSNYTTTVGNGLHSEQFTALLSAMWSCLHEKAWCDVGDGECVALHDPYGALERRLFAQMVCRSSLRMAC